MKAKKRTKRKSAHQKPVAVLVTTQFRGVFFGYVADDKKAPDEMTLTNVKNCLYWSKDIGGFLGLAAVGPSKDCRIGKRVDSLRIFKITSISPVSAAAVAAWEAA